MSKECLVLPHLEESELDNVPFTVVDPTRLPAAPWLRLSNSWQELAFRIEFLFTVMITIDSVSLLAVVTSSSIVKVIAVRVVMFTTAKEERFRKIAPVVHHCPSLFTRGQRWTMVDNELTILYGKGQN